MEMVGQYSRVSPRTHLDEQFHQFLLQRSSEVSAAVELKAELTQSEPITVLGLRLQGTRPKHPRYLPGELLQQR